MLQCCSNDGEQVCIQGAALLTGFALCPVVEPMTVCMLRLGLANVSCACALQRAMEGLYLTTAGGLNQHLPGRLVAATGL
jgi:hypothetical protein